LRTLTGTKAELAAADIKQTRRAGLHHLDATPLPNPELGETTNPRVLTGDFVDFRPFTGPEHVKRHQHRQLRVTPSLLRFCLS
jgi:hypothetical protein